MFDINILKNYGTVLLAFFLCCKIIRIFWGRFLAPKNFVVINTDFKIMHFRQFSTFLS